ncbi:MAG: glycosyltransferase family 4 protein [Desulfatibacillaceae bacterium]
MAYLSTVLFATVLSIMGIPIMKAVAVRVGVMDAPEPRKVHKAPVPKAGGVAMALATVSSVLIWAPLDRFLVSVIAGGLVITAFGFLDDARNLGYRAKFAGQIMAALIVMLFGGLGISTLGMLLPGGAAVPALVGWPLTLVCIVGVTNAVNLSDGLDGLAGGMGMMYFLCLAYLAHLAGDTGIIIISLALAGAIFGFLRYNTHPASVFMGDAGSQFLGFVAITCSIGLTQRNEALNSLLPLLLVGFPVLDTLTVMAERMADGRSPFVADKNHFHHKLIRIGLSHSEAVVAMYGLQGVLVILALMFRYHGEGVVLGAYLALCACVLTLFHMAHKHGYRIPRTRLLDNPLRRKLGAAVRSRKLAAILRSAAYRAAPVLLLITGLSAIAAPHYVAVMYLAFAVAVVAAGFACPDRACTTLRVFAFLAIPPMVVFGEISEVPWMSPGMHTVYNLSFGALLLLVVMSLRLGRESDGFEITPTDILILSVALVVPNLPGLADERMGIAAAKIIVLFFTYKFLTEKESPGGRWLGWSTSASLAVAGVAGLLV